MASPQPEPFVKFSKELFDALLLSSMPAGHKEIVLAIIRRTYGDYGKKAAPVSLSLIGRMTGRGESGIRKAIEALDGEGVIRRTAVATFRTAAHWSLNKNYEEWGRYSVHSASLGGKYHDSAECPYSAGHSAPTARGTVPLQRPMEDKRDIETKDRSVGDTDAREEVDDFAGIDFGEEEPEAESPEITTSPVQERATSPGAKKTPAAKKSAGPPVESLIATYNELCPSLPRVQKAEGARRNRLLRAHAQMGEEGLRAYFARVEASDFLAGRKKDWRADLDFILKPENMGRILEGVHDNRIRGRTNVASALAIQERCEREAVSGVSG
jgi:hypothetical protein